MSHLTPEKQLEIVRKAWGLGKKEGYCFFPWVKGAAENNHERKLSFKEGPAFRWPAEKDEVLRHLETHADDDVFWCPMLFEAPYRRAEFGLEERCLWADLDEVDPRSISDYPPTVAWETSPGRYQALWLLEGFIYGASGPGMVNQRLTYHLEADPSGWDTTQLLRLPGWSNHKPERRSADGSPSPGRLLWTGGRTYEGGEFDKLPLVEISTPLVDVIESELERVDRHKLWAETKLKLPHRARELYEAHEAGGDRSENLWYLIRCLADAGCSVSGIVALVRETVWNKFADRADELKRLTHEAAKAISARSPETEKRLERERQDEGLERPRPVNLFDLVRNLEPPQWLVQDVMTLGSCCFIAGQPKSYKSWIALDLALSVGSGMRFLNRFEVLQPGPVLYLQEEDSGPLVKDRLGKVWGSKTGDRLDLDDDGTLWWVGKQEVPDPDVDAVIMGGLTLSDPAWIEWLDETLGEREYRLCLMDPLGLVMGDVEDRLGPLNSRILRPLRQLGRKHECGVLLVHHQKKGGDGSERGGQMMLGSAAYHAWADDAMYLRRERDGGVRIEQESKHANLPGLKVVGVDRVEWSPQVEREATQRYERSLESPPVQNRPSANGQSPRSEPTYQQQLLEAFERLDSDMWYTTAQVAQEANIPVPQASVRLKRMGERQLISGKERPNGKGGFGRNKVYLWRRR